MKKAILIIFCLSTVLSFSEYPVRTKKIEAGSITPPDTSILKNGTKILKNGTKILCIPFTPTSIDGCILWLDAGKGVTKDINDYVSRWDDYSGKNYDAIQGTGAYQPKYIANGVNEKPIIRFDGNNDFLNISSFDLSYTKDLTLFVIWKTNSNTASQTLLSFPEYNTSVYFNIRLNPTAEKFYSQVYGNIGRNEIFSKTTAIPNTFEVRMYAVKNTALLAGDQVQYWINGSRDISCSCSPCVVNTNNWTNDVLYIGQLPSYGIYLNGDIAEIIIYGNSLQDENRIKVEKYLNKKYNLY